MQQFNPFQLIQFARMGRNPMDMIQQIAAGNPAAAAAMSAMQGKNPHQLRQMAENLARERGTNLEAVAQSLGIQIPK